MFTNLTKDCSLLLTLLILAFNSGVFLLVWETQLPNSKWAGVWVERSGFETWLGHCVMFLDKTHCSQCLFTQEYKWVMANCWGSLMNCWEVTMWWTGFLPRREQKTRISVSWMGHVAWIQTLLYYTPWQPPLYHGFSPSFLWWLL